MSKGLLKAVDTVTAPGQTISLSSHKDQIHHLGSLSTTPLFPKDLIGLRVTNAPSDGSGLSLGLQEESPLFSSPSSTR